MPRYRNRNTHFFHLLLILLILVTPGLGQAKDRAIGVYNKTLNLKSAGYDPKNFYALIIGINKYKEHPNLTTAVKDAQAIAKVFKENYGFKHIELLLDDQATKYGILSKIKHYRDSLTSKDSLVIYFAGHGQLENNNSKLGYWVPNDGHATDFFNDISHSELKENYLKLLKVKHLLLLVDSCYSGAIHRGAVSSSTSNTNILKSFSKPSRIIISSGDLEPVPDDDGSGHSPFCNRILQYLRTTKSSFEVDALYYYLRNNLKTEPIRRYLDTSAHQPGGSFVFVPNSSKRIFIEGINDLLNEQFTEKPEPSPDPPLPYKPIHTEDTNYFIISNPKSGLLIFDGKTYNLRNQTNLELAQGVYSFSLSLEGKRMPIHGKFEVLLVDHETQNASFGVKDTLFKEKHIRAALGGSPVKYTLGLSTGGKKKKVANYTLSLRKIE